MRIKIAICTLFLLAQIEILVGAAIFPLVPYSFETNSDYDSNFKEVGLYTGISRNSSGFLQLSGAPNGIAIYDTSATGGSPGNGGASGSNFNNDLDNFTISGHFSGSTSSGAGLGFLLRLNDSESNGYFAAVLFPSPTQLRFQLFEGAGINSAGSQIFLKTLSPDGFTFSANTFYSFSVSVNSGDFTFDFSHGLATASFTDTSVSTTRGQVGINLATASPTSITQFDDFELQPIPEPDTLFLIFSAVVTLVLTQNLQRIKDRTRRCS